MFRKHGAEKLATLLASGAQVFGEAKVPRSSAPPAEGEEIHFREVPSERETRAWIPKEIKVYPGVGGEWRERNFLVKIKAFGVREITEISSDGGAARRISQPIINRCLIVAGFLPPSRVNYEVIVMLR